MVPRTALNFTPQSQGKAAAGGQYAVYFAEGSALVWKELQALLAHGRVKCMIRKRHRNRSPLEPRSSSCMSARHGKHRGVDVETDNAPARCHLGDRVACNGASATCDIQQSLARLE